MGHHSHEAALRRHPDRSIAVPGLGRRESYARERWGDKLAAFEAILRRDPFNATVGRSMLRGALFAPAIAGASFLIGAIPILMKQAWPSWNGGAAAVLYMGGPVYAIVRSISQALLVTIGAVLFMLAWTHREKSSMRTKTSRRT